MKPSATATHRAWERIYRNIAYIRQRHPRPPRKERNASVS